MGASEDQGRVRVIIVVVLLLAMEATVALTEEVPDYQAMFTRAALLVVLLTFLWLGHGWARVLVIIISGLAGILAGILVVTQQTMLLLPVTIGALVSVYLLLSPEVKAFQAQQRSRV